MHSDNPKQVITAVYISKTNIGLCVFNEGTMQVQCSQVTYLIPFALQNVQDIIRRSTAILTNQPSHLLFQDMPENTPSPIAVLEKDLQHQIIAHHLKFISGHLPAEYNHAHHARMMARHSPLKFQAVGILLHHLTLSPVPGHKLYLEDILFWSDTLLKTVIVDGDSLDQLDISRSDVHPSLVKRKQRKEGFSLLAAYESHILSAGGKKILQHIFCNPTYDYQVLEERLSLIEWMERHMTDRVKIGRQMRKLQSLEQPMKRFQTLVANADDWAKLVKTVNALLGVRHQLSNQPNYPPLIEEFMSDHGWDQVLQIESICHSTIEDDFVSIRQGVDMELDNLKRLYNQLPHQLSLIASQQGWGRQLTIVFMWQVGYLVRLEPNYQLPQQIQSSEWEIQQVNKSGTYFKNPLTQHLDKEYGDMMAEIRDIEEKILSEISQFVMEREASLVRLYREACRIDCFWGVSQASQGMCRPCFSSEALIVVGGWHPLLDDPVHNHTFSFPHNQGPAESVINSESNLVNTHYSNRCNLLTGPNGSGKSVYSKQVGIIVYLAHLGFPVPASLAEIPLTDCIVFISSSVVSYLSEDEVWGMREEINTLSRITTHGILSNKSLVILDEIGTSISYEASLKLLSATVKHLTQSQFTTNPKLSFPTDQFKTPLCFIVTHLSAAITYNLIKQTELVRFMTMLVENDNICLFKLKPGVTRSDYGIRAASSNYGPEEIALARHFRQMIDDMQ